MRAAAAALIVALAVVAARADDESADEHAFVEVVAPRDRCFVGETVRVRVRIGFDEAFFRSSALQMFQRTLDLPARLEASWLRELQGATALPDAPRAEGDRRARLTFALGDGVASALRAADDTRDGRTFAVVELEKAFRPDRPGELTLAAPVLRFAFATRFEDDFVRGRVPLDRRDVAVSGTPLVLRVAAVPDDGRPAEFTGAIGRFTTRTAVDRGDVVVGEHFRLTLTLEGDGDLAGFEPPRVDAAPRFHVYGLLDDRQAARRVITYDVAALSADATETPRVAFASFDPEPPGRFVVERTPPLPLRVRAAAGTPPSPGTAVREDDPSGAAPWIAAGVVVAAAAVSIVVGVRRRRAVGDSASIRVRAAAGALAARLDAPGADAAAAFAEFLAACLGCPVAAVISPDLAQRLGAAGVPGDLAHRAAALLESLVAARYGGGAPTDASATRMLGAEIAAVLETRGAAAARG